MDVVVVLSIIVDVVVAGWILEEDMDVVVVVSVIANVVVAGWRLEGDPDAISGRG